MDGGCFAVSMSIKAFISYDDTLGDQDALALGRLLARAGAELTLVYVRHSANAEPAREQLEESAAKALLDRGACWLGDLDVQQRVVLSASTGDGLAWLAEREGADIVVFGSDYRTPPGRLAPQKSTQRLLEGGGAAVAIAPAGLRTTPDAVPALIGVLAGAGDDAALVTARGLADALGARLTSGESGAEFMVVGSRPEAAAGRVMLTTQAQGAIENARGPVLVLPRSVALAFPAAVTSA